MKYTNENNSRTYQWIFIAILMMLGLVIGICQEMLTPTLPNIRTQFNVSYETLGTVLSLKGFGNIIFTVSASYIYDSCPHVINLLMISECILGGLCTIIIPLCQDFFMASLVIYVQSGCLSALNTACQLSVLKVFKSKSIGKMQLYHTGFGVGRLLSGFIAAPFISNKPTELKKLTKYCFKSIHNQNFSSHDYANATITALDNIDLTERKYAYAYFISGMVSVLIGALFLIFECTINLKSNEKENRSTQSWAQRFHPKYLANNQPYFGLTVTILIFIYYFSYLAGQSVLMPYIIVFAIDPCKQYFMSQRNAAYLHSLMNGCFIASQILTTFILDRFPTYILLTLNFFNVLFVISLCFLSDKLEIVLWICVCGMRICNSVVYPTGTSYLNKFIVISSSFITVTFIGSTIGVIVGQSIGAYLLDNFPSIFIMYACCGFMLVLLVVSFIIVVIVKMFGKELY